MKIAITSSIQARTVKSGFTLAEVLIAMGISILTMAGIVYGYIGSCKRAEWSAYSLAAHSLAMQRLEQTRSCKWDLDSDPGVDELVQANFPSQTNILDVPSSGTNVTYAVNFTTITEVSITPPVKKIKVDCVWTFMNGRRFTNTVMTYRGPDN